MGLTMSSFVVPLLLLCSPFVHSKSFESIDFVDYDSGTDIGWNESECGRLWSDYFNRHVQLGTAFSIAHGKFRLYYLIGRFSLFILTSSLVSCLSANLNFRNSVPRQENIVFFVCFLCVFVFVSVSLCAPIHSLW